MFRITLFLLAFVACVLAQGQDCRNLPPLRINPKECCKQPKLIDDSIFARCFENFGSRNFPRPPSRDTRGGFRGGPPGFPSTCVAQCVFNSTNLSVNDPTSAETFITATLQQSPEWIPVFLEGFNFCGKAAIAKLQENNLDDIAGRFDGCSPLPGIILACLHSQVFTNCPQNVWNNAPGCDQLKGFFTACPLPPMF